MNILYASHPGEQYGTEAGHVREVIANLRKLGHTVDTVQVSRSPVYSMLSAQSKPLWVRILSHTPAKWLYRRLKGELGLLYLTWVELGLTARLLRHRRPDAIYSRHRWLNGAELLYSKLKKVPYIREVNGFVADEMQVRKAGDRFSVWLFDQIEGWNLRRGDRWVAVTAQIKATLAEWYRVPKKRIAVVENGVNTELFCPESMWKRVQKKRREREDRELADKEELTDEEEDELDKLVTISAVIIGAAVEGVTRTLFPPKKYRLCFVGQLWEHQNIEKFCDALPLVQDADLTVVGGGPLLEPLKERYYPKPNSPLFTGRVEQERAADFMRRANVCVGPLTEGWYNKRIGRSALKLGEYLACGKPVVCSRTKGTEFVEQEGLGLLVDDLKPETIAGAVSFLLERPELRKQMGRKARRYAVKNMSWEQKAGEIAEVIGGAVAE